MRFNTDRVFLGWFFLGAFSVVYVTGLGCQHSCDCGFDWDGSNEDLTLRYEVFAGLVGAFSPLVLGGLGMLTYKLCTRSAAALKPPFSMGGTGGIAPGAPGYPHGGGAGGNWRGPNRNGRDPMGDGGGYPTSLYGESEDGFTNPTDRPVNGGHIQGHGGGGAPRPGSVGSKFTNIHRNVKSDMTNQWLRNVNLRKY